MQRLAGKVALITGGNSGIGRATAALFAAEGARVLLAARRESAGLETVQAIRAAGGEAAFVRCDVREVADCERAVATAVETFGRLDIVFNNAGIVPFGTELETPLAVWNALLATNVSGTF